MSRTSLIAAALVCGALAVGPGLAGADSDSAIEELIVEMATDQGDHEALARYYKAKAEQARAEAHRHDRMGRSYHGGKMSEKSRMKRHCGSISEKYEAMAKEYDELAKLHESAEK